MRVLPGLILRPSAVAVIAVLLAAGCGGAGSGGRTDAGDTRPAGPARSDAAVIRAWIRALDAGDYGRAASYFAKNAVVEQVRVFRLPDRSAALAFNRSLPCKARVTDVEDEGATTLAAFQLRPGPGGAGPRCDGGARVRFRIRDGKFLEWRQLLEAPPGQAA